MLWGYFSEAEAGRLVRSLKTERSKMQISLLKTWSRALKTLDWADDSPSNRTVTLSTQPRQCRSDLGTDLSGPAKALI